MAKTITVNLRNKLVKLHTTRRRAKAFDYLREIVGKQEHVEPEAVKLDGGVNEFIFKSVYKRFKPMKLTVEKTGDLVRVRMTEQKKPAATTAQPAKGVGAAKPGTTPAAAKNAEKTPQAKKQEKVAKEATKAQPRPASTTESNTTQMQSSPPKQ